MEAGQLKAPSVGAALLLGVAGALLGTLARAQTVPEPIRLRVFGAAGVGSNPLQSGRRIDGSLGEIARRYQTLPAGLKTPSGLHQVNPALRFRQAIDRDAPEVLIDAVSVGDVRSLRDALRSLGLRNEAIFANDVGGWLPVGQIDRMAASPSLRLARASMPRRRAVVATQGDFAQHSAAVRTSYPTLTGAGVTVGVLSDSFNCYQSYAAAGVPAAGLNGYASNGFTATYASDQQSAALPAGVNVLEEASCLDYGAPYELPFGDEGRAILQIVHAVAPAAGLAFYTATNSEADFASGIERLAQAGAKVIADDIGYPDEPFFQDGVVAQAIDQVASQGVAYFSSAGNEGSDSYENTAPVFPVISTAAPNAGERLLNFDGTNATTTTALPLTIPALIPGEYVFLIVQWDQPYVTGAPGSGGATSSLDLCIASSTGSDPVSNPDQFPNAVSCSGPNALGADPVLMLMIGNPASASGSTAAESVTVSIGLLPGSAAPGRIKFLLAADGANATINAFQTNSATIQGHPGAAGAAAVGAAFYLQTPSCGTSPARAEAFSSTGGDPILFDSSGHRLASPQLRVKPDFVAPDGANDTFLGDVYGSLSSSVSQCQNDTSYPSFFGTSAAAPHAAAAAALLLQSNPALAPSQIQNALRATALPMVGNASLTGAGFIQVDAALAQLPPGAPTLALSTATVAAGGSVTLSWSSLNTTACAASGSWSGTQATTGSLTVTPTAVGAESFTLTCRNAQGSASASTTLTVTAAVAAGGASGGGGGGGGGLDWSLLSGWVLLAALSVRRRLLSLRGDGA